MTYGDDRMSTKPGVDWAEIERRVRAGESARAVSRDLTSTGHKISHTAINKHCRRGGWKLPDTSAAAIAKHLQEIEASQRATAKVLGVGETTVARDLGKPRGAPNGARESVEVPGTNGDTDAPAPNGALSYFDTDPHQAVKTGKPAANHVPAQDLDSDTTDGATQELPTGPNTPPVETPQKKAKPPRRRVLWALQRNGTARVVGFYDKGV